MRGFVEIYLGTAAGNCKVSHQARLHDMTLPACAHLRLKRPTRVVAFCWAATQHARMH